MSIPNLQNNIIQSQGIVLNQVPLSHTIMTNVNATNGIPIGTALSHAPTSVEQMNEMKTGIVVDGIPIVGMSNIPVQAAAPVRTMQSNANVSEGISVLTKPRLSDLVRDTDSSLILEDDVEEALLAYADEFINRTLEGAVNLAKHRHINTIEVKDVQLYLGRKYGVWVSGFGTDELRPYKRKLKAESHKQRLALIRKA
ncbi:transcription initiation factor TFIID subunit 12 isoform X2 [Photinus pyralis]|uniref:transcription initiation factor TFIID subunit 12 isoform X2 n=1 Tax=Photinus pyralis TaxID=7054 RepID=UPI00126767F0|nr:transcription initiation factor TFIID subunit 12 isoform X2 [Photinus pyralis]